MIQIGSRAIKKYFSDFREPKDFDFIVPDKSKVNKEELSKHLNTRVEIYEIPCIWKYIKCNDTFGNLSIINYLEPNLMYTLKISHIFWDINWHKHIYDIGFLKNKGCVLNEELFKELYSFWKEKHSNNKRIKFEKTNEEFFTDKVVRKYDHDFLHEIIKFEETPAFFKIKKNLSRAEIYEDLFEIQDKNTKFNIIKEEAYVLALERYLIPETLQNYRIAYARIIKAMITRLSPLWLALYIVDNYRELINPEINFYQKFKEYELSRINQ